MQKSAWQKSWPNVLPVDESKGIQIKKGKMIYLIRKYLSENFGEYNFYTILN